MYFRLYTQKTHTIHINVKSIYSYRSARNLKNVRILYLNRLILNLKTKYNKLFSIENNIIIFIQNNTYIILSLNQIFRQKNKIKNECHTNMAMVNVCIGNSKV